MEDFNKHTKNLFATIIIWVLLIGIGFGIGFLYCKSLAKPEATVTECVPEEVDLKLPTEEKKTVVTENDVSTKLKEIGELSTYMGEYHVVREQDFSRYIIDDYMIPGTTNTIHLSCDGIVKVSYKMTDIGITVENEKIIISIPEAYISDNYLIWDSVECEEKNSLLNPIDFAEYKEMITSIEEEGLENAKVDGIYELADENLQKVIKNFLGAFEGYSVEFI